MGGAEQWHPPCLERGQWMVAVVEIWWWMGQLGYPLQILSPMGHLGSLLQATPSCPCPNPLWGLGFPSIEESCLLSWVLHCLISPFVFRQILLHVVTGLNMVSTAFSSAFLKNVTLTMNYVYFWRCFLPTCPSLVPMALRGLTGTQHPGKDHLLGRRSCQSTVFSGL